MDPMTPDRVSNFIRFHRHFLRAPIRGNRGVTFIELMVATAVMTIGILGMISSFRFITKGLYTSRSRILATNLAQEKIESLKNLSYYNLLITTTSRIDDSILPGVEYDIQNYPQENISIGNILYTRETFVALASMNNNIISTVAYTYPDTGLKQIAVTVMWTDSGVRRKYQLSNLLENPDVSPLDSGIAGNVKKNVTGTPNLASAIVNTIENPGYRTLTDTNGNYSFRVAHGTYTIHVTSSGFTDAYLAYQLVTAGATTTSPNVQLTPISSGSINGIVWISSHIVISQVVASSQTVAGFDVQYLELYNPTTAQFNIATAGGSALVHLYYNSFQAPNTCSDVPLVYVSTYVVSYGYYLIANTASTFYINGAATTPDAYYASTADGSCSSSPPGWSYPNTTNLMRPDKSGSWLLKDNAGAPIDAVGWLNGANTPTYCETNCIPFGSLGGNALRGEQIVRISSPAASLNVAAMWTYGHAYDSDDNSRDFYYPMLPGTSFGITYTPRTTNNAVKPPVTGTPAVGTKIGSSDPYSASTAAYVTYITSGPYSLPYAQFTLLGVSTGSWQVDLASSTYYLRPTTITVTQATNTPIPLVFLTSSTLSGFIKGKVLNSAGWPIIPAITLNVGGVTTTASTVTGDYFAMVSSGIITAVANVNNANPGYVQQYAYPTVNSGLMTDQDFNLSPGGSAYAYITSGTSPLPSIVVVAIEPAGSEAGSGTSDNSGYAYINNIASGTYDFQPPLDTGQSSNPFWYQNITVVDNALTFIGTFTVTGAFSDIVGTVTYNGASLTTGGLVLVSTKSISSTPSTICVSPITGCSTASAALGAIVYSASTKADGTYDVQVRGGATYYLSIFIPTITGTSSVSITNKSYSGIGVAASGSKTQNITVP